MLISTKRIMQSMDNGGSAIIVGPVSVVKSSPKAPLILGLSVVFGGMIGVFFILVHTVMTKCKDQLAKS